MNNDELGLLPKEITEFRLEDIELARQYLRELCHNEHQWRMCVPVHRNDSDMVFSRVIKAAESVLKNRDSG